MRTLLLLLCFFSSLAGANEENVQSLMVREIASEEIKTCQKLFAVRKEIVETLKALDLQKHPDQVKLLKDQQESLELQLDKMYQLQAGLNYRFSPTQGRLYQILTEEQFLKLSEIEKQQALNLDEFKGQRAKFVRAFSKESNIKLMTQLLSVTKKVQANIIKMEGLIQQAQTEDQKQKIRLIRNQLQKRFNDSSKMLVQGFGLSPSNNYYFQTQRGRIYLDLTCQQLKALSQLPTEP